MKVLGLELMGFTATARFNSVSGSENAFGLGDILLRAKYNVFNSQWVDFTTGVNISIPTGRDEDLLGTGRFGAEPFFVFGKTYAGLWNPIALQVSPHLNVAYKYDHNSIGEDLFSYAVGFDASFRIGNHEFAFASDLLGKHVIGEGADLIIAYNYNISSTSF